MFTNAKVGDKVWAIKHGWGIIKSIDEYKAMSDTRSLTVEFPNKIIRHYNTNGKFCKNDINQSLFLEELIAPLVDTKVLVWNHVEGELYKQPMYFHSFTEDARIRVFADGRSSFSAIYWKSGDPILTSFDYYEIYKEEVTNATI